MTKYVMRGGDGEKERRDEGIVCTRSEGSRGKD